MSFKAILSRRGGLREIVYTDNAQPGVLHHVIDEDETPVREHAHRLRHAQEHRTKREMDGCKVVAVIPMAVHWQSEHEGWDRKRWDRWLRDPDNSHLVIDPARKRRIGKS
jgi:hypothetical protein